MWNIYEYFIHQFMDHNFLIIFLSNYYTLTIIFYDLFHTLDLTIYDFTNLLIIFKKILYVLNMLLLITNSYQILYAYHHLFYILNSFYHLLFNSHNFLFNHAMLYPFDQFLIKLHYFRKIYIKFLLSLLLGHIIDYLSPIIYIYNYHTE